MKRLVNWISWISAGAGVLFIIFAVIATLTGKYIFAEHRVNYFQTANTFFLITIGLYVYQIRNHFVKE
ncbi:MAG: hypothetical protein WCE64_01750 [Bacteroidales bacterium]